MSDSPQPPASPGFFQAGGLGSKIAQGILPSFVNNLFANYQQRKQNDFNRQQIQEQNEYNSPTATMNRMMAAGISPKAAQESIAGVPTLGSQSEVATATPYQGNMPGTDFMTGFSQGFANDLTSTQAQSARAQTELDFTRLAQDLKESQQRVQESIANMRLTDAKTATERMVQMFRRQEQPYHIKLLEQEVIQGTITCAAWNSLTPDEKRQFGYNSGQAMLSNAEYQHKKSSANVANFEWENKATLERFKFDFDNSAFGRKELTHKTRVLKNMYDALDAGFLYDIESYGWSTEQVQHYRTKKSQIFKNFDLSLDNEGLAGLVLKKTLNYQNLDNKGTAIRTAIGLSSQLFSEGMQLRNFLPLDPKVKTGFKFFDN